jgi:hypothetical protein
MQVALPLISPPPKVSGHGMRGSVGTRRRGGLQSRAGEFGSVAVLGLESMRDLRSLRDAYGFERVPGDPGAARRGGERRFVATALLLGAGSGRFPDPLRVAGRSVTPSLGLAERSAAADVESGDQPPL